MTRLEALGGPAWFAQRVASGDSAPSEVPQGEFERSVKALIGPSPRVVPTLLARGKSSVDARRPIEGLDVSPVRQLAWIDVERALGQVAEGRRLEPTVQALVDSFRTTIL